MSKYTFSCEEKTLFGSGVNRTSSVNFEADSLNDILEQFEMFLRGQGFDFEGVIDVVPVDDGSVDESGDDDDDDDDGYEEQWSDNPFFNSTDETEYIAQAAAGAPVADYDFSVGDITIDLSSLDVNGAEELYQPLDIQWGEPWPGPSVTIGSDTPCKVCKLTRDQLGDAMCFDKNCGFGLQSKAA